ncbi:MAG: Sir2 silent information regulator family NAD-dependent deacetylase [Clostridia bacterium]|nr:Sir2 silent information regulator family NAD-dependent deacetylase [Clostridia bacterium]
MGNKEIQRLARQIESADAIVIGAGSGLSTSAGFTYSGERFQRYFADFIEKYHIPDMYSGGFYPFESLEEYWAWWSRHIYYNRYVDAPYPVYRNLLSLVKGKDYFVLTTNVDHQFQKTGFDKHRLFYTQGDYGLWQCMEPCHRKTYDNEDIVRQMVAEQKDMRVPTALIPHCPICGKPMTMNLRADNTFVEDEGWHRAAERYSEFLRRHDRLHVLFLELGVGGNTPGIIKYPFWKMTYQNPKAVYACINDKEAFVPSEIKNRSICIDGDIGKVLTMLVKKEGDNEPRRKMSLFNRGITGRNATVQKHTDS